MHGPEIVISLRPVGKIRRMLFGRRAPLIDLRVLYSIDDATRNDGLTVHGNLNLHDLLDPSYASNTMTLVASRVATAVLVENRAAGPRVIAHGFDIEMPPGTYSVHLDVLWADGHKAIDATITATADAANWVNARRVEF
jgi:hypothetical protein